MFVKKKKKITTYHLWLLFHNLFEMSEQSQYKQAEIPSEQAISTMYVVTQSDLRTKVKMKYPLQ